MQIGICDDEVVIRNELLMLCSEFKQSKLCDINVVTFSSGEDVLKHSDTLDILFLDIQMNGLDGMKTAERIREKDDSMLIIFLTGFDGYMQAGYRVKAFRYLLKPVNQKEFDTALTEAIQDITKNKKVIVDKEGQTRFISLDDIIYVEHIDRCSVIRTRIGSYESTTSMHEWDIILCNGDFFRVHKSYIVNLGYVEEIGKVVTMDNGEKVELAIRQAAKLKKACKEYRRRKAR